MGTMTELPAIVRALNQVETTGQARVAVGQSLIALSGAYEILPKIPTELGVPLLRESYKGQLDMARLNLESWFATIPAKTNDEFHAGWALNRWRVEKAYVEIAGVEGAAAYSPRTSNLEILTNALRDAPKIVGQQAGEIINQAAQVAGKGVGGLAGGLGLWGWLLVVVVVAVLLIVSGVGGRGGLVGQLLGGKS